jgi:hypothetical protein
VILEVKLSMPGDHSRHVGRMSSSPPTQYVFEATVLVLQRIRWGPQQLYAGAIRVLAIVPEKYRRHLPALDSKRATDYSRVSSGLCWLPAAIDARNVGNAEKVRSFIESGEYEWTLEEAT